MVQEDEDCTDEAFRAHHIHASRTDTSGDLGSIGSYRLGADRSASLCGTTVFDTSDDGELYVGAPPSVAPDDGIEYARVGEERPDGWKGQNFLANDERLSDVLARRRGRFFLRTYEPGSIRLADSTSFRYWPNLREIRVDDHLFQDGLVLIPPAGGTKTTTVRLVGRSEPLNLEVLSKKHARLREGAVAVEPTVEGDEVRLLVREGADEVSVVVSLPRVWWRLGATGSWTDRPIQMSRTDFRTSQEKLEVLVPNCIDSLEVGFETDVLHFPASYARDVRTKKEVEITLEALANHEALGEQRGKSLALRIHLPEGAATAVEVLPDRADSPLPVEPISSPDSGHRVCRGVIVRRKVFGGVVLEASADGVVRIAWGKKRHTRVIQRLLPVPRLGSTIPQGVVGISYKTRVVLHPTAKGSGVTAPHPVKAILELSGVRDARATTFGPSDPRRLTKATLDGLSRLQDEARTRIRTRGQRR